MHKTWVLDFKEKKFLWVPEKMSLFIRIKLLIREKVRFFTHFNIKLYSKINWRNIFKTFVLLFSRETKPIGFGEKVCFKERTLAIMEANKSKLWTCRFGKLRQSIYSQVQELLVWRKEKRQYYNLRWRISSCLEEVSLLFCSSLQLNGWGLPTLGGSVVKNSRARQETQETRVWSLG